MRKFLPAAGLGALLALAQPALAAPLTYDCQARMARVDVAPPADPAEANPWQCAAPANKTPMGVHWQRASLEYCRLTVSLYREALETAARVSKRFKPHRWLVLMDADETVLDNSLFERERARCGGKIEDAQWRNWVRARMAPAVPGAAAFTQAVHRMGGLVGIVTNRSAEQDILTRMNLKSAGIWFDYEIGVTGDHFDKLDRWRGAEAALTTKKYGRPVAAMWVGDQVSDLAVLDKRGRMLRALGQADRGDTPDGRLFQLPNPMYGTWAGNPDR